MAAITNYPNGLKTTQTYSLRVQGGGPGLKSRCWWGCALWGALREIQSQTSPVLQATRFSWLAASALLSNLCSHCQFHLPPPLPLPSIRTLMIPLGFPGGSVVKNPPANAGDTGSIPGWERSPGEGSGNPLQCSFLENSKNRGSWRATVHGVAKSWTRLRKHAQALGPPDYHG